MKTKLSIFIIIASILSCNHNQDTQTVYKDQIGDTSFDPNLDDINFKFCDSTNVLHKRTLVRYDGGLKALENDLISSFKPKPSHKAFNGYFIIRFAINCNNELGRYRMEILDSNFNITECPEDMKQDLLAVFKNLKKWSHPFYEGKSYDGYTFYTIKIKNGTIEK
ncbi:MAG: hypothetical protein AAFX55_19860 [Bacteroidota bacterium]